MDDSYGRKPKDSRAYSGRDHEKSARCFDIKEPTDCKGLTGYNIMTEFSERFGVSLSSGTVYSSLYSLERNGLIESQMKGASRGYTLTEKGQAQVNALSDDQQAQQFIALLEKPLAATRLE